MTDRASAPALDRGLAVLETLDDGAWASLDGLAGTLAVPKSSLLRILGTLEQRGYVERSAQTRQYRTRVVIQRVAPPSRQARQAVQAALEALSAELGLTVEWYRVGSTHAELTQRAEAAEGAVRIRARVGHRRARWGELDAIALVTHAALGLEGTKRQRQSTWAYRSGDRVTLTVAEYEARRSAVGTDLRARDSEYNNNGIRRLAKGVRAPAGRLFGILAVPAHFHPKAEQLVEKQLGILDAAGRNLEAALKEIHHG